MTPIWASALLYYVSTNQQQTYVVFQAFQSDRRLGNTNFKIPGASYGIFSLLGLTNWIPFYDRIIVPQLENLTNKEMRVGLVLGIITTIISAIVEDRRKASALSNPIGKDSMGRAISSL